MTLVSGPILDASGDPIPGAVLTLAPPYKAAKARVPGTVVAEPLTATADGAGVVSFVGLPGRMVGEIRAGGRRWPIELIIPDQSTAALADCVEAGAIEIPPASVAAAQAARDQALAAVAGIDDIVTAAVADAMAGIGGGYQPLSAVLTATTASYTTAEKSKLSLIANGATANQSDAYLLNRANHSGTQLAATISDLSTAVGAMITAQTGIAGGLASLDGTGRVPSSQLPSFVDDVVEAANFGALPGTGETGKIYVTLDTNKTWRWSGSAYVEISASPGSTDAVTEGATNLYFTSGRVRTAALTGFAQSASRQAITAADSVLSAFNKIQRYHTDLVALAFSGTWSDLGGRPTTLTGFGITDGLAASDAALTYQAVSAKGQPGGYAGLDGTGRVPSAQLPSFVDDVVEAGTFGALPGSGETGKIYVTLDTNRTWRWSGSAYVEIAASPGSTDAVTEGSTNLYHTPARVRGTLLTGLAASVSRLALADTDSILGAFGKVAKWLADLSTLAFTGAWADISGKPTTLDGYALAYSSRPFNRPSGEWLICASGAGGGNLGTTTATTGRMELYPWTPARTVNAIGIAIRCTTGDAGTTARIVIYNPDASDNPGALSYQSADIDLTTASNKQLSYTRTFYAGVTYWLGVHFSGGGTGVGALAVLANGQTPDINGGGPISSARKQVRRTVNYGSGAPANWGFTNSEINTAVPTAVWVQAA